MNGRSLLRQHDVRPRKGLGQHFLVSDDILAQIAAAAHLQPTDVVVEVGPGMGALTTVMARQAGVSRLDLKDRLSLIRTDTYMVRDSRLYLLTPS